MIRHRFDPDSSGRGMYVRETAPDGAAGTVLWIHGLGESALSFEGLLTAAGLAGWRHLAPDLPGYGKSPWPAAARPLEAFAADLVAWTRRCVEGGPLVVAGHSMGGVVGLDFCERWAAQDPPFPLAGFLNIEGNVSFEDCGFSARAAAQTPEGFAEEGFAKLCDTLFADGQHEAPLRVYYPSVRICDPRAYHLNSTELVAVSRDEGIAGRLAALGLPLLYVAGSPRGTGAHSRALLDAAGVAWHGVEDSGHWPFLDQPESFVAMAAGFFDRCAAG